MYNFVVYNAKIDRGETETFPRGLSSRVRRGQGRKRKKGLQ